MDNVCNRCLFSIPSKVEMAEEQEYLRYRPQQKALGNKPHNSAVIQQSLVLKLRWYFILNFSPKSHFFQNMKIHHP